MKTIPSTITTNRVVIDLEPKADVESPSVLLRNDILNEYTLNPTEIVKAVQMDVQT